MTLAKVEYVWLDGTKPEPQLRSKTKIIDTNPFDLNEDGSPKLPEWSFDGSSTQQAEGNNSDCVLRPVKVVADNTRDFGVIAMCEVYDRDGNPHPSNTRAMLTNDNDFWYGFEQEYVLFNPVTNQPCGFNEYGDTEPQGPYYCGVGNNKVSMRKLVEEHLEICLEAGLSITGINAEVMLGQWEFQVFGEGSYEACDSLWLARYFLLKLSEKYEVNVSFEPKPMFGDWNGSGMHCNFSNKYMREEGGQKYFTEIFEAFKSRHNEHIEVYGSDNDLRLTGIHETAPITEFTYGLSDRGASMRIPPGVDKLWKGYLEDRRPAANADPYLVAREIQKTIQKAFGNYISNPKNR